MAEPVVERRNRIEGLYKLITEKDEISIAKVKDAIRNKFGLSERVINEYIMALAAKPGIKVEDGIFKTKK
jgi:hypothetical protein